MSAGHKYHPTRGLPLNKDRERELELLLSHPQFQQAIAAYTNEDDTHDIPYVGGSGTDWRTIFWDRHFAKAVDAGFFRLRGAPIDPRQAGKIHEAVEGAIIHLWDSVAPLLGWPGKGADKYTRAHDVAGVAERHVATE